MVMLSPLRFHRSPFALLCACLALGACSDDTDHDFDAVAEVAGAITPVPGGVGPMTRAMLLQNTLEAARLSVGLARRP